MRNTEPPHPRFLKEMVWVDVLQGGGDESESMLSTVLDAPLKGPWWSLRVKSSCCRCPSYMRERWAHDDIIVNEYLKITRQLRVLYIAPKVVLCSCCTELHLSMFRLARFRSTSRPILLKTRSMAMATATTQQQQQPCFITLDGSTLEGGGQILRNAVAFSALLSKPVSIINVRHNRSPPGLKAQHAAGQSYIFCPSQPIRAYTLVVIHPTSLFLLSLIDPSAVVTCVHLLFLDPGRAFNRPPTRLGYRSC